MWERILYIDATCDIPGKEFRDFFSLTEIRRDNNGVDVSRNWRQGVCVQGFFL